MKNIKIPAVTRAQMVEVDRLMIEEYGITLLQMMENAGRNLATLVRELLDDDLSGKRVAVLCGSGNNGGGGLVTARHLANWGADVVVSLAAPIDCLKGAPVRQLDTLKKMNVPLTESYPLGEIHLIIDALIGYGLKGTPRGKTAEWIQKANSAGVPILLLDIPTGLDADTGLPLGACIRALATLTLALPKVGMLKASASEYLGDLYIGDISVPPSLLREIGIEVEGLFASSPVVKIS